MRDYYNSETERYFETEPYRRVLLRIGDGKENTVHLSELTRYSGIPDRQIRKIIEFLRRQGIVIISSNNGYYFPADITELEDYVRREEHRARSTFFTLKAARQLLKKMREGEYNNGTSKKGKT